MAKKACQDVSLKFISQKNVFPKDQIQFDNPTYFFFKHWKPVKYGQLEPTT